MVEVQKNRNLLDLIDPNKTDHENILSLIGAEVELWIKRSSGGWSKGYIQRYDGPNYSFVIVEWYDERKQKRVGKTVPDVADLISWQYEGEAQVANKEIENVRTLEKFRRFIYEQALIADLKEQSLWAQTDQGEWKRVTIKNTSVRWENDRNVNCVELEYTDNSGTATHTFSEFMAFQEAHQRFVQEKCQAAISSRRRIHELAEGHTIKPMDDSKKPPLEM